MREPGQDKDGKGEGFGSRRQSGEPACVLGLLRNDVLRRCVHKQGHPSRPSIHPYYTILRLLHLAGRPIPRYHGCMYIRSVLIVSVSLALTLLVTTAIAQDAKSSGLSDRLDTIERRLDEIGRHDHYLGGVILAPIMLTRQFPTETVEIVVNVRDHLSSFGNRMVRIGGDFAILGNAILDQSPSAAPEDGLYLPADEGDVYLVKRHEGQIHITQEPRISAFYYHGKQFNQE